MLVAEALHTTLTQMRANANKKTQILCLVGLPAASITRRLSYGRVVGLTGGEERAACVVQGSQNALVTRDQTTARSGDHPTPRSDASRFSRRSTGWGSNPTPHLSVSLRRHPLQPCHSSSLPGQLGPTPRLPSPCCSLCLFTLSPHLCHSSQRP